MCNRVKHEAVVGMTGRSSHVNTPQRSRQFRESVTKVPPSAETRLQWGRQQGSGDLHCTQWNSCQNRTLRCILVLLYTDGNKYSGMAGRTVVCWISVYSQVAICTFFNNLMRWKFPYENHLVEISRESYDILVYEWWPNSCSASLQHNVSMWNHVNYYYYVENL